MQPLPNSQSPLGHIGVALSQGAAAADRQRQGEAEAQQQELKRQETLADIEGKKALTKRRLSLGTRGNTAKALTPYQSARMDAATAKQFTSTTQSFLKQLQQAYEATFPTEPFDVDANLPKAQELARKALGLATEAPPAPGAAPQTKVINGVTYGLDPASGKYYAVKG